MIGWTCFRTRSLLHRPAPGLTAGEGLAREQHLATCPACAETADLADSVRALVLAAPPSLRPGAIERITVRAVEEGLGEDRLAERQARPRFGRIWIMVAAGAAAVILLMSGVIFRGQTPVGSLPASATNEAVLLAGSVVVDGRELGVGTALPDGARMRTPRGARLSAGPATLELSGGSELVWTAERSTAHLHAGRVSAEVDPKPQLTFRVATDRFVVEVVGTRFSVSVEDVRVTEGVVRVFDHQDSIVRILGPREAWSTSQAGLAEDGSAEVDRPAADTAPSHHPPGAQSVADHLSRARRHLAKREVAAARRALTAMRALSPTRGQEADAATMAAECAFVEGDVDEALRLYLAVVDRFSDLAAGENALFAAARLSDRASRGDAARQLLGRYLDRYPNGQFQREAQSRLRRIETETQR